MPPRPRARRQAQAAATARQHKVSKAHARRRAHHSDVVAVQQDCVELRHAPPLRRALAAQMKGVRERWRAQRRARTGALGLCPSWARAARAGPPASGRALLRHVLEDHVDVHVEAAQRAHQLLLALHNNLMKGRKRAFTRSEHRSWPASTHSAACKVRCARSRAPQRQRGARR